MSLISLISPDFPRFLIGSRRQDFLGKILGAVYVKANGPLVIVGLPAKAKQAKTGFLGLVATLRRKRQGHISGPARLLIQLKKHFWPD